jgi:hypothetical protein
VIRASRPHAKTVHGMRVDAALIRWRDEKRKWKQYISEHGGGYFIAEDRDRLPVRPRGFHVAHTL